MALIECPDCGRKISDRAKECPDCSCPVAEVVTERRVTDERSSVAASREILDGREVDCPRCGARGYRELPDQMFDWCVVCEHTGRLTLGKADDGYYAVARYAITRFLAGEVNPESSGVVFHVGLQEPTGFQFKKAGPREEVDPIDPAVPWEEGH